MSFTQTQRCVFQASAGNIDKANTYSAAQQAGISVTIAAGTHTYSEMGIDVSTMVGLVMYCSRDITITVNDDGSPDATIALLANKPLLWTNDGYFTNPLGVVDVTSMKAVLAAGADADLIIEAIYT